ncbi:transcription factor [Candidatus Woesearchaeota archaeon]|nr:transcription factor [Candidatus Woesearchaeota archaeon]
MSFKLVEEVVTEVAGSEVLPLAKALKGRENVSEYKLAGELKKEINHVRNMLYKLHDVNLVSFIRRKDKQKGWYIYYWTFETNQVKYLLKRIKDGKVERLKERLEREKGNQFYKCTNSCVRLNFDQSADYGYKCPECGELLNIEDNSERIKEIQEKLQDLEKKKVEA